MPSKVDFCMQNFNFPSRFLYFNSILFNFTISATSLTCRVPMKDAFCTFLLKDLPFPLKFAFLWILLRVIFFFFKFCTHHLFLRSFDWTFTCDYFQLHFTEAYLQAVCQCNYKVPFSWKIVTSTNSKRLTINCTVLPILMILSNVPIFSSRFF